MVAFLKTACIGIFVLSSIFIIIVLSFGEVLISIFVSGEDSKEMIAMSLILLPMFGPYFVRWCEYADFRIPDSYTPTLSLRLSCLCNSLIFNNLFNYSLSACL